jgi:hypothetical protein
MLKRGSTEPILLEYIAGGMHPAGYSYGEFRENTGMDEGMGEFSKKG